MANTLEGRGYRQIFDQQAVRLRNHFDQRGQSIADKKKVNQVVADGLVIIRRHRLGIAANNGYPFRIGFPSQSGDHRRIAWPGPAQAFGTITHQRIPIGGFSFRHFNDCPQR